MLRRTLTAVLGNMTHIASRQISIGSIYMAGRCPPESDEEFDKRYEAFFNKCDIDGWEVRKGMNDIIGMDMIPEPKIIVAALKACRRVDEFALAVRFLEACKDKCGPYKEIYPYLINEVKPTLVELGINTPEELGYDTPELALKSVWDM